MKYSFKVIGENGWYLVYTKEGKTENRHKIVVYRFNSGNIRTQLGCNDTGLEVASTIADMMIQ